MKNILSSDIVLFDTPRVPHKNESKADYSDSALSDIQVEQTLLDIQSIQGEALPLSESNSEISESNVIDTVDNTTFC